VRRLGRERRCGGNWDRGFGTAKVLKIIDFLPLFQIRMTFFKEVRNQFLINNDEIV